MPKIVPPGVSFVSLPGDDGMPGFFRSYKTPWIENDEHQKLMSMKPKDFGELARRTLTDGCSRVGTEARFTPPRFRI